MSAKKVTKFTNPYILKSIAQHAADPKLPRERFTDDAAKGAIPGLTVSITAAGARFSLRFWDEVLKKQRPHTMKMFHAVAFDVDAARAEAHTLKGDVGQRIDIIARAAGQIEQVRAESKTFNEVADLYIDYLRVLVQKPGGAKRARRESWDRVGGPEIVGATVRYPGGYLKRARAAFGTRAISLITPTDIATLLNGIAAQDKPGLVANLRSTLHGLFKWACEAGRDREFVKATPCINLGKRPPMHSAKRALSNAEILTFWTMLDHEDVPVPRAVALALKLMLCTGMRGGEIAKLRRENIRDLFGSLPAIMSEEEDTKSRELKLQPLNSLAVEIVKEVLAMSDRTTGLLFPEGKNGADFKRHNLTDYLNDRGYNGYKPKDGVVRQQGLRSYLGFLKKWRPHDLRRTAASLILRGGAAKMADVTLMLDHSPARDTGVAEVTMDYIELYIEEQAALKRPLLDALDRLLRGVLGLSPIAGPAVDVAALQQQIAELQAQVEAATKVVPLRLVA